MGLTVSQCRCEIPCPQKSKTAARQRNRRHLLCWAELDSVVHGLSQILLTSDVSFGRQNRSVSEQELNLFQFTSGRVAPARAAATKIVRRKSFDSGSLGALLYYVPNDVLSETISPDYAVLADRAKYWTLLNTGCSRPCVNPVLDPLGNWNRTYVPSFSNQIDNRPVPLPLLNPFACQAQPLRNAADHIPTKGRAWQRPFAAKLLWRDRTEEVVALF